MPFAQAIDAAPKYLDIELVDRRRFASGTVAMRYVPIHSRRS